MRRMIRAEQCRIVVQPVNVRLCQSRVKVTRLAVAQGVACKLSSHEKQPKKTLIHQDFHPCIFGAIVGNLCLIRVASRHSVCILWADSARYSQCQDGEFARSFRLVAHIQ